MGMMVTVRPGMEVFCDNYPHQKWAMADKGEYAECADLQYAVTLSAAFWNAAHGGTYYTKPLDSESASSLVPILEAQLRAFEYWEPDESKDYP